QALHSLPTRRSSDLQFLLPLTSELYAFQDQQMHDAGKKDKATELSLATRIKRDANVRKNYQGKLKGLRNIDLVNQKRAEDEALAQFIATDAKLKAQYGTLLEDIDKHYQLVFTDAKREIWFNNLYSGIRTLQLARTINGYQTSFA